jgi:hypothetical protein
MLNIGIIRIPYKCIINRNPIKQLGQQKKKQLLDDDILIEKYKTERILFPFWFLLFTHSICHFRVEFIYLKDTTYVTFAKLNFSDLYRRTSSSNNPFSVGYEEDWRNKVDVSCDEVEKGRALSREIFGCCRTPTNRW